MGIEPTTNQLLADYSTTELHANSEAKLIRLVLPLHEKFNKGEKQSPYLQKYLQAGLVGLEPTNYLINSQAFYLLNYKPVMRVRSKEWLHPPEI